MKFIILVLLFAVCQAGETRAQANWKPGVVILASGDTIRGELSERAMGSFECRLKNRDVEYTPGEVLSFYVPGETYFERASIKINEEWQMVFMKVLASGQADLLLYKADYYLRDAAGDVTKLEVLIRKVTVDGKIFNSTAELFKEVLSKKLAGCEMAESKIKSTSLTTKSLTRIVNLYNACFQATPQNNVSIETERTKVYLGLQYNWLTTHLTNFDGSFENLNQSTFDDPYKQSAPGFYLQIFPKQPKGASAELGFYKVSYHFKASNDYTYYDAGAYHNVAYSLDGSYSTVVMPILLKYSFLDGRIVQPYVGLGITAQFNKDLQSRQIVYVDGKYDYTYDVEGKKRVTTSFFSQAGVNINVERFVVGANVNLQRQRSPMDFGSYGGTYVARQTNVGFTLSVGYAIVK